MKTLVLGLGNDLMSDDGAGILAARILADDVDGADVVESPLCGLALLEHFLGYQRAIVIDAVQTGRHAPGTIIELDPGDIDPVETPSPHYTGLPEMLALAEELALDFPTEIKIIALEVEDLYTVGGGLTPPVQRALPEVVACVKACLQRWNEQDGSESADITIDNSRCCS